MISTSEFPASLIVDESFNDEQVDEEFKEEDGMGEKEAFDPCDEFSEE